MSLELKTSKTAHVRFSGATRALAQAVTRLAGNDLKDTVELSQNTTAQQPGKSFWAKIKNFFSRMMDRLKILFSTNKKPQSSETVKPETTNSTAASPSSAGTVKPPAQTIAAIDPQSQTEILSEVKDIFTADWGTVCKRFHDLCGQYGAATPGNLETSGRKAISHEIVGPLGVVRNVATNTLSKSEAMKLSAICEALEVRLCNEGQIRSNRFFPETQAIIPFEELAACVPDKYYDPRYARVTT